MKSNYYKKSMEYLRLTIVLASVFFINSNQLLAQALSGGTVYPINGTANPPTSFSSIANATSYVVTNGISGTGNVVFQLQSGYTGSSEPATGIFLDSVPGANATRGIIFRPGSSFTVTISGSDTSKGLLNFRGCSYITIDGRQGGTGSSGLTFFNYCTSSADTTCTVRFMNGANNNAIRYCTIQGASKSVTNGGVVLFSYGNSYAGNSFNTIESCNIDGTSNSHNGICSNGSMTSTAVENTQDTIRNNNIYDFFDNAGTTGNAGIRLQVGSSAWSIIGNSIYQTVARTYTTLNNMHYGILIGEGGYYTSDYYTINNNYIGGSYPSCVGSLTITGGAGVCGFSGIYMYLGNNSTVSGNTIKNISLTYASASGSYSNTGIYSFLKYSGTVNILNNLIDTLQYANTSGTIVFNGIQAATTLDATFVVNINPTFNVTNNIVRNLTLNTSATFTSQLYGLKFGATSIASQGTTTYFDNLVFNANGNTIDGLRSNGSNASSFAWGIQGNATNGTSTSHYMRVYPTITNNIIRNLFSNGITVSTGNPVAAGFVISNASNGSGVYGDTIKFRNNTVYNLYGQNVADVNSAVGGVFVNGGKVDISKNKIYNLYNASYASTNSPFVYGVNFYSLALASSADNNFISIGDTATSNQSAFGILNSLTATGALSLYNNTILISGVSSNKNSAAIQRGDPLVFTGLSTTLSIKNNLLINRRTSSGVNAALFMPGTVAFTSDNNTFLDSIVGYYNSSAFNFSSWKSTTLNDAYSYNGLISTTTDFTVNLPKISLADVFANANYSSAANMLIDNTKTTCWLLFGKGIALPGFGLDYNSSSRSVSVGVPTCIGANEFTTSTTPPNNFVYGNYALNDSITSSFAGRDVLRIYWTAVGSSLPTTSTAKYYSGKTNGTYISGRIVSASYWTIAATGGSGYSYSSKVFYGQHEKGTIVNSNATTKLAFYTGTAWNYLTTSTADTTQYPEYAMVTGRTLPLSSSAAFTLTDNVNALPVTLSTFTAERNGRDVSVNWTTSNELNNKYFTVERSIDNQNFIAIGKVAGAMNSTVSNSYMFIDRDAQSLNQTVIYYRLKQVDADGNFTYSTVVSVKFIDHSKNEITLVPNPFTTDLSVSFNSESSSQVVVRVTNMSGQLVSEKMVNIPIGSNTYSIDEASTLTTGIYFVTLVFNDGVSTYKVVKMKN
jgi:hypothetical protein